MPAGGVVTAGSSDSKADTLPTALFAAFTPRDAGFLSSASRGFFTQTQTRVSACDMR